MEIQKMAKKTTIKELDARVKRLEEQQKPEEDNDYIIMVIIFYLTMPIWLPIHMIWFLFNQLVKPFRIYRRVNKEDEDNYIKGEYNPCEYVWSKLKTT